MDNVDGYVTKDSLYRLISNLRVQGDIDDNAASKMVKAIFELGGTTLDDNVRLIDATQLKKKLIGGDGHDDDRFTEGYNFAINEVKHYIDEAPTVDPGTGWNWISADILLPPCNEKIIVVSEAYTEESGYNMYNSGCTVRLPHLDFTFWCSKITHWLPFPEPPKGE